MNPHGMAQAPSSPVAAEQIEYFNAPSYRRPSAVPGLVLGMLALGLIVLGGCFLIGVLILYTSSFTDWTASGIYFYLALLYVLAGACFAGAVALLLLAVKSLMRTTREESAIAH